MHCHAYGKKNKILYSDKDTGQKKERRLQKRSFLLSLKLPQEAVKTITCDLASEFAGWREIKKALNCNMYFADSYCAWQKGTNENLNGLLKEFYPKKAETYRE